MSRTALARYAAGLTLQPGTPWSDLVANLRSRPTILLQVVGGLVCLVLLALRVSALAATNPAFAGAGGSVLAIAALTASLLAYLAYLPVGTWIVATVLRPVHPDLTWRRVLPVFSFSTLPLLAGWILQTAVGWLRSGAAVASAGDFHRYVEVLVQTVTLRADAGLLVPGDAPLLGSLAGALGVFWVWHAVVLWGGLRELTGGSRRWAWAVVLTLFGVVLVASLLVGVVALQWRDFVVWT